MNEPHIQCSSGMIENDDIPIFFRKQLLSRKRMKEETSSTENLRILLFLTAIHLREESNGKNDNKLRQQKWSNTEEAFYGAHQNDKHTQN